MHPATIAALRCPHCAGALHLDGGSLVCGQGHRFDRARQGYVNLVAGGGTPHAGDDASMLDHRQRALADGLFDPVLDCLADTANAALGLAADAAPSDTADASPTATANAAPAEVDLTAEPQVQCQQLIVDVGAGPGVHLARVIDDDPRRCGIAVDVSKYAARRAARAHPRVTSIVADAWTGLPIADGSADLVLVAFAPRNASELARILAPHGRLLVLVPADDHLAGLRERLGLLAVEPGKPGQLSAQLAPRLELVDQHTVVWDRPLTRAQTVDLVGMGPSARHHDLDAVASELAAMDTPPAMHGAVRLLVFAHSALRAGG